MSFGLGSGIAGGHRDVRGPYRVLRYHRRYHRGLPAGSSSWSSGITGQLRGPAGTIGHLWPILSGFIRGTIGYYSAQHRLFFFIYGDLRGNLGVNRPNWPISIIFGQKSGHRGQSRKIGQNLVKLAKMRRSAPICHRNDPETA